MRITLDWGQDKQPRKPKPETTPAEAPLKARDFEETPLPDWEAWAKEQLKPSIKKKEQP